MHGTKPWAAKCKLPRALSQWSHQEPTSQVSNWDNTCVYQGSSLEMQYLRVPPTPPPLSWSCGHPLPSTGQNPRLPESTQHQSHCSSGTMRLSEVLCQCSQLLIIEVPRCQQKHCKLAFLWKAVLGLLS